MGWTVPRILFPRLSQPVVLLLAVVALAHGQVDLAADPATLQTRLRCSDLPADPPACPRFVAWCSDNYVIQVLCPVACGGCDFAENTTEPPTIGDFPDTTPQPTTDHARDAAGDAADATTATTAEPATANVIAPEVMPVESGRPPAPVPASNDGNNSGPDVRAAAAVADPAVGRLSQDTDADSPDDGDDGDNGRDLKQTNLMFGTLLLTVVAINVGVAVVLVRRNKTAYVQANPATIEAGQRARDNGSSKFKWLAKLQPDIEAGQRTRDAAPDTDTLDKGAWTGDWSGRSSSISSSIRSAGHVMFAADTFKPARSMGSTGSTGSMASAASATAASNSGECHGALGPQVPPRNNPSPPAPVPLWYGSVSEPYRRQNDHTSAGPPIPTPGPPCPPRSNSNPVGVGGADEEQRYLLPMTPSASLDDSFESRRRRPTVFDGTHADYHAVYLADHGDYGPGNDNDSAAHEYAKVPPEPAYGTAIPYPTTPEDRSRRPSAESLAICIYEELNYPSRPDTAEPLTPPAVQAATFPPDRLLSQHRPASPDQLDGYLLTGDDGSNSELPVAGSTRNDVPTYASPDRRGKASAKLRQPLLALSKVHEAAAVASPGAASLSSPCNDLVEMLVPPAVRSPAKTGTPIVTTALWQSYSCPTSPLLPRRSLNVRRSLMITSLPICTPSPEPPASTTLDPDSTARLRMRDFNRNRCDNHGFYANFPLSPEPPYDYATQAAVQAVPSAAKPRLPMAVNAMLQRSDSMISTA